jgi:hypothetical protein
VVRLVKTEDKRIKKPSFKQALFLSHHLALTGCCSVFGFREIQILGGQTLNRAQKTRQTAIKAVQQAFQ